MVKIFSPTGKIMNACELAKWANMVHSIGGGKGSPFTPQMYEPHGRPIERFRLSGHHCSCGCDGNLPGTPTLGQFKLLPLNSIEVREGGKAYMRCQKCGEYSHL